MIGLLLALLGLLYREGRGGGGGPVRLGTENLFSSAPVLSVKS